MEVKRILLPHQYYYPNMNLLKNRSGEKIEWEFYQTLLQADSNQMDTIYVLFADLTRSMIWQKWMPMSKSC